MDGGKKIEMPARRCEQCGGDMKFVVTLPRAGGLPPLNTFR
jgi:hypothetical protein